MRVVVIVVLAALCGAAIGQFGTWTEFSGVTERFEPNNGSRFREGDMASMAADAGKKLVPTSGAKVRVTNGEVHDFGKIERNTKGRHDFLFTNEGDAPLRLQSGGTSCKACTISQLAKEVVEPGETVKVTVEWNAISADFDFRKEAYILTSDPTRSMVLLVVKGQVLESLRLMPGELELGSVASTSGVEVEAQLVCFQDRQFEIVGTSLTNQDLAEHFEVTVVPLTPERLSIHQGSQSGYAIRVKLKPGVPVGTILQTVKIKTNWEGTEEIEMPVRATIVSDISILQSPQFDSKHNILTLGVVKQGQGKTATLPILVKGPHRADVKLTVSSVVPDAGLKVRFGDVKSVNEGAVLLHPLIVEIPADSAPVSRLGGTEQNDYGKIVIDTTHPEAKQLLILVRFAVQSETK